MRSQAHDDTHEMELKQAQRISDEEWLRIEAALTGVHGKKIGKARRFVDAVMWVAQTGAFWTNLPSEYGSVHSVYVRFRRWLDEGRWEQVLEGLESKQQQSNLKNLIARRLERERAEAMAKRLRAGGRVAGSRGLG